MNNSFDWLDTLVIIVYFVQIIGYGLWLTRKVKNSSGYFIGERKFGWWIMMGQHSERGRMPRIL